MRNNSYVRLERPSSSDQETRSVASAPVADRTREFRTSFVWRAAFALVGIAANFAIGVVVARRLGKADVASYYVMVTTLMIGPSIARFGLGARAVQKIGALRGEHDGEPGRAQAFAGAVIRRTLPTTVLVSAALGCGLVVRPNDADYLALASLATGILALEALRLTFADVFAGLGHARWSAAMTHSARAALSALGVFVLLATGQTLSLLRVYVALLLATLLLTVAGVVRLWPELRAAKPISGYTNGRERVRLREGSAFLIAELAGLVIARGDVWIAARAFDAQHAALYATASVLAMQLGTPVGLANMAIAPIVAEHWRAGRKAELEQMVRSILTIATVAMVPVVAVMVLGGGSLVGWLYGDEFRGAAGTLAILSLGNIALFVFGAANAVLLMIGGARMAARMLALWLMFVAPLAVVAAFAFGPLALAVVSATATIGLYGLQAFGCKKLGQLSVWPATAFRGTGRALGLRSGRELEAI